MFDSLLDRFGYDKTSLKILASDGVVQGFEPSITLFGLTYHSRMIPPFKPNKTLILGYGMGTVADLTRRIWGDDCKIVCVDKDLSNRPYYEYQFFEMDALQALKSFTANGFTETFDYIVIDLFNGGELSPIVFSDEFVELIEKISSKLVSINVPMGSIKGLKGYYDKFDYLNQSIVFRQCVTYWTKKEVKNA